MPILPFLAAAMVCASPVAVDGDTLHCASGAVRLLGIDAPELPGHCRRGRVCVAGDGFASMIALDRLIAGRTVLCQGSGRDAYGRLLARCSAGGVDLSCAMLARRQAVRRYSAIRCEGVKR